MSATVSSFPKLDLSLSLGGGLLSNSPSASTNPKTSSLDEASDLLGQVLGVMTKHEEDIVSAQTNKLRNRQDEAFERESKRREKYSKKRMSFVVGGAGAATTVATLRRASDSPQHQSPIETAVALPLNKIGNGRRPSVDVRRSLVDVRRTSVDVRRPSLDHRNTAPHPAHPSAQQKRASFYGPPTPLSASPPRHGGAIENRRSAFYDPQAYEQALAFRYPPHPMAASAGPVSPYATLPRNSLGRKGMHRSSMSFPPPAVNTFAAPAAEAEDSEDDNVPLGMLHGPGPLSLSRSRGHSSPNVRFGPPTPASPRRFSTLPVGDMPTTTNINSKRMSVQSDAYSYADLQYQQQQHTQHHYHHRRSLALQRPAPLVIYPHTLHAPHPIPDPNQPLVSFTNQDLAASRTLREFVHNNGHIRHSRSNSSISTTATPTPPLTATSSRCSSAKLVGSDKSSSGSSATVVQEPPVVVVPATSAPSLPRGDKKKKDKKNDGEGVAPARKSKKRLSIFW